MARRLRPAKDTHRIVCGQRSVPGNRSTRIQSRHRISKELLAGIVANPHPRKAAIQTLLAARRIDSPAKPSGLAAERISCLAQPGQRNPQQDRQTRTASNLKPYVFTPDSGESDGLPDVLWVTGGIYPELQNRPEEPYKVPRIVFRNLGNGRFEELISEAGSGIEAKHCS